MSGSSIIKMCKSKDTKGRNLWSICGCSCSLRKHWCLSQVWKESVALREQTMEAKVDLFSILKIVVLWNYFIDGFWGTLLTAVEVLFKYTFFFLHFFWNLELSASAAARKKAKKVRRGSIFHRLRSQNPFLSSSVFLLVLYLQFVVDRAGLLLQLKTIWATNAYLVQHNL